MQGRLLTLDTVDDQLVARDFVEELEEEDAQKKRKEKPKHAHTLSRSPSVRSNNITNENSRSHDSANDTTADEEDEELSSIQEDQLTARSGFYVPALFRRWHDRSTERRKKQSPKPKTDEEKGNQDGNQTSFRIPSTSPRTKYRRTPVFSGTIAPFAIMLEIPGFTSKWYVHITPEGQPNEYRSNPILLDVGLAFSLTSAVVANLAILARFSERMRPRKATAIACAGFIIHDIINMVALIIFGVIHAVDDGFTYSEAYWMTTASTVASLCCTISLLADYIRTKDFKDAGSGLTRKQSQLVIVIMAFLAYISLSALIFALVMQLPFLDAMYFSVESIATIGLGDIVPNNTASKILLFFIAPGGGAIFSAIEANWSYFDGFYFVFVVFTSIGYGDFHPTSSSGRAFFIVWALFGVGTLTVLFSVVSDAWGNVIQQRKFRLGKKSQKHGKLRKKINIAFESILPARIREKRRRERQKAKITRQLTAKDGSSTNTTTGILDNESSNVGGGILRNSNTPQNERSTDSNVEHSKNDAEEENTKKDTVQMHLDLTNTAMEFHKSAIGYMTILREGRHIVPASSPAGVASLASTVITMVPSSPQVKEVYLSESGILQGLKSLGNPSDPSNSTLCIDCTTLDPLIAVQVANQIKHAGLTTSSDVGTFDMIDAPVSGGTVGARAGTLSFMVGSDLHQSFTQAEHTLLQMGSRAIHCGKNGNGLIAKIANNLLLGISMLATSEAMLLGTVHGLSPQILAHIINTSTGKCWSSEMNNPCPGALHGTEKSPPAERDYEGGFAAKLQAKDLGLALSAAQQKGVPTPLGMLATNIYKALGENPDFMNKDFSVAFKALSSAVGKIPQTEESPEL
ncbi:hypothetical protein L7F22_009244 [Adiantum nelumboides]|nr:hypothetical protein [Adiantum nelumboides]